MKGSLRLRQQRAIFTRLKVMKPASHSTFVDTDSGLVLQSGKLRGTPVPLDRSGVSFCDTAFAAGDAVTADEAQRGYLAASSGKFYASCSGSTARPSHVHMGG